MTLRGGDMNRMVFGDHKPIQITFSEDLVRVKGAVT